MRKSIWVLENIKGDFSFFQKFNLLCLFASVSLWRKFHPQHHTTLYCDLMTKALLEELGVLDLWHDVDWRLLSKPSGINKKVFWAGSKPQILSELKEPVSIVDNDWIPFRSFEKEMQMAPVVYSHDEDGSRYYLNDKDWYVTMLEKTKLWSMNDMACNVSFLTFNDYEIQKQYADLSVQLMKEWSDLKIEDNRLIIFAEQKILKQILLRDNVEHMPLFKEVWSCRGEGWLPKSYGINEHGAIHFRDELKNFKHYGVNKRKYKDNMRGYEYQPEVDFLYRCIRTCDVIDVKELELKLNDIVKRV